MVTMEIRSMMAAKADENGDQQLPAPTLGFLSQSAPPALAFSFQNRQLPPLPTNSNQQSTQLPPIQHLGHPAPARPIPPAMSYPEQHSQQSHGQYFNGNAMSESLPEHTLPPHYDYSTHHTSRPPPHRPHSSLLAGLPSMSPPTSIHQSQQHQSLLRRADPVIQQYDILGRRKPKSPREPHSWSPAQDALLRRLKEKEGMGWREIALYCTSTP
ncbi:hypothetical protein SAICODRAFT_170958 [Saitoella complicata NRRL Y-17804]|uniref:uncharacterized protein n=1 Tax=Saitoella complicata (strain BCRC 22490 / CBS 7301 / JCM 7358 / NBRC 10748 / NRRL Y-17804) TaxID=698492 RepID=UPI0008668AE5|nr:uncharacterized protein SAICODRAFT_170958 [Saitoella complicata NRRL Y-17804]ODQ50590.1 hypothetical protein SAICODRAFT_170958 [Saitoella complicata NRRL Y-17804]